MGFRPGDPLSSLKFSWFSTVPALSAFDKAKTASFHILPSLLFPNHSIIRCYIYEKLKASLNESRLNIGSPFLLPTAVPH
jgi:hypothetical protein